MSLPLILCLLLEGASTVIQTKLSTCTMCNSEAMLEQADIASQSKDPEQAQESHSDSLVRIWISDRKFAYNIFSHHRDTPQGNRIQEGVI